MEASVHSMATIKFGDSEERVITRDEWPLEKAQDRMKDETIAVLGYGVQGPGQALNLRDNGFRVIVGQRKGGDTWRKALRDGWVEGRDLFEIEEAAERGTVVQYLLSDAGQIALWSRVKPHLTTGKCLYFSHGFTVTFSEDSGVVPPEDIDVVLVAPKGSGTSLRRLFLAGKGLNSSYAVFQDFTGRARDRALSIGIGVGSGCLFETDFRKEVYSDLTGERGVLMGAIAGVFEAQYEAVAPSWSLALRGVQRDRGGADAEPDASRGRERHGLDVCELFHHGAAGSSRLAAQVPGRGGAPVRRTVRERAFRQGGAARHRVVRQTRLSRAARGGAGGNGQPGDLAGGCAAAAAAAVGGPW